MTGYRADFADGTNSRSRTTCSTRPPARSCRGNSATRGTVPPYVNLPHPMTAGGPGFYGAEHAPFVIEGDPVQPDFEVRDLAPVEGVDDARRARRRAAARRARRPARRRRQGRHDGDLLREGPRPDDRPGGPQGVRHQGRSRTSCAKPTATPRLGQCALLARRLVEAGCRFVGIDHSGWDTHFTCFPSLEKDLIPAVDKAFSALVARPRPTAACSTPRWW